MASAATLYFPPVEWNRRQSAATRCGVDSYENRFIF